MKSDQFALKVFRSGYLRKNTDATDEFKIEARILENLSHPNINKFVTSGEDG